MSELVPSKEARMQVALCELARRTTEGTTTLAQSVDDCASTLAVIGIEYERATFMQRCTAAGIVVLAPRLWHELKARCRSAGDVTSTGSSPRPASG